MKTTKINNKAYSPNLVLYLSLIVLFSVCFIICLCVAYKIEKIKDIMIAISGLFGGGFSSVIVAWIIDAVNCKEKNAQFLRHLRIVYDKFLSFMCAHIYIERNHMIKMGLLDITEQKFDVFEEKFFKCDDLSKLRLENFYSGLISSIKAINQNDIITPFYNPVSLDLYTSYKDLMVQDVSKILTGKPDLDYTLLKSDIDVKIELIDGIMKLLNFDADGILKIRKEDEENIKKFLNAKRRKHGDNI